MGSLAVAGAGRICGRCTLDYERVKTMKLDKIGSVMFYDKDNTLVGSIGIKPDSYTEQELLYIAKRSMSAVFSTEEVARIVYFKVETHHHVLHEGESTEPTGRGKDTVATTLIEAAPSSYTQSLVEHGLFEKDFYIKHKLETLRILHGGESFKMQQSLIVESLIQDLGIDTEGCSEKTSETSWNLDFGSL